VGVQKVTAGPKRVSGNSFKTLEFDRIQTLLRQQVGSALGRVHLEGLCPLADPEAVRRAQARTTEAVGLLRQLGRQPYHDLPDTREALGTARARGAQLEPRALADVASFVEGGVEIARRLARAEGAPVLSGLASQVQDTSAVAAAIRRALLPTGELADDASPRLAELRRTLARLRSQLTSVMEGYLRSPESERLLQDRIVTTRNDRYVLLLKAEQKGQLPGIVHGGSGSGASLFVEPLPAVELNNDIVELQDAERREVLRILQELTAQVGGRAAEIEAMGRVLGELDAAQAMALLSVAMDAHPPQIVEGTDAALELVDARHPLLMPELAQRLGTTRASEPVPVSLSVGGDRPVLVISGPNTGGKTVALKSVGLLALMAQCGLHVPAGPASRLPVFRSIFADIGDDQSIAENLSTFSAHLAAIASMARELELPALVLLDEVGAGTDPTEGGALGVAIVEHFRRAGATVVATTHHGLMKAYAQSTPGALAASFGYDPASYQPTYRLTLGAPGRSLALEMAERLGLPASVVADARARRDVREEQAEALLARLEKEQAAQQRERERLDALKAETESAHARVAELESELRAKKRREVELFAKELRRRGELVEQKAEAAIAEAVRRLEAASRLSAAPRIKREAAAALREAREAVLADPELELPAEQEPPSLPLAVGMRVRVKPMGLTGELVSLHGDEAELAVSGKRLRVAASELVGLGGKAASTMLRAPSSGGSVSFPTKSVPAELNLIGLSVEDAQDRVGKLLDDAALSDRRELRLVHGFGEGKLRKAVAEMLGRHPLVASWRLGGPGEGGGGATIVELRD
jgi:DNA mismatch repair protein MutS2